MILAYVVGQIVGGVAGDVIEGRLVRRRLHYPTFALMGGSSTSKVALLFPGYYRALPADTQKRIKTEPPVREFKAPVGALFFHCHAA